MERLTVDERLEGFRRFFAGANDAGPLVGFFWDTYYPWRRYGAAAAVPPGRFGPEDLDPDAFRVDYERLYERYEAGGGDFLWTGAAFWGVPWMEAICGCPVVADHDTGSARSLPPDRIRLPSAADADPWTACALRFLELLRAQSRGRYPLGTTLMRGLSDVLAALYGNPEFVFAMTDHPEAVADVVDQVTDLWIGFARRQLDAIPRFRGGVGSYFYDMWLPDGGCFLQEDASALLSPDLFEQFILPGIRRIVAAFHTTVIHLHPASFIPVDQLVRTDVSAIELHIDLGGPSARDLLPVYRTVQSRKPLVIWGDLSDDDVAFVADHLDLRSLAVKVVVRDQEHAERVWRRLKRGA